MRFWLDYYTHILKPKEQRSLPFLSMNFIYGTSNLAEAIIVLSLLELPEKKQEHTTESLEGFKFTAGSNCMLFLKEMTEGGNQKLELEIMASQKFFDERKMYVTAPDGKSKMFKKVTQFETGLAYGSRVAITNSSESEHTVQIITEIPQGAIPLNNLDYSKSQTLSLKPLSTEITEFFFYFPRPGNYTCYPATINKDGFMVTSAAGVASLEVVEEVEIKEMNTISDILSSGK